MLQKSVFAIPAHTRKLHGLNDAYCDSGYTYDPTADWCVANAVTVDPFTFCQSGYHWVESILDCVPDSYGGITPSKTDNGDPNFWLNLLAVGSQSAANLVAATNAQYYTPGGSYTYGTGPYRALTPTIAQQYLQLRPPTSTFGGMSTSTLLLIGAGLLAAFMFMRR